MTETFDLAIIGAGPGGFDAALRARELGLKVALIEKSDPGGTCLNTGCIPTKALLASTKLLTKIKEAASYGLSVEGAKWDAAALTNRVGKIVSTLRKGMFDQIRRSGVEWVTAEASFAGKNRLALKSGQETKEIEAASIIIASGTEPIPFPGTPFDGRKIVSSAEILLLSKVPERLLILGGGVVGVEFASIFQALGVKVTIVEMLERLIATEDEEVSRRLESLFRRKGIEVLTGEKVTSLTVRESVEAALASGKTMSADQCLVAIGRRPRLERLGLEKADIKVERGVIAVNEYLETSTPGVFAIGDVTTRSTGLAHGASAEGVCVVENFKGSRKVKMNYEAVPSCIYTDPEVASVGASRSGNKKSGEETVEVKIVFAGLGKSQIEGETEGFLKMTTSKRDGKVIGVTGIGARMSELIHEATLAVAAGITVETLAGTIHAHPTEGEIFQKAAQKLKQLLDRG